MKSESLKVFYFLKENACVCGGGALNEPEAGWKKILASKCWYLHDLWMDSWMALPDKGL